MIDFDLILTKIGGLRRFQIFLVCITVYSSIPAGYNGIAPVFINYTPDYRFGRKSAMMVSAVCTFLAVFGCSFARNFWLFVACRFTVAFFSAGIFLSNFVYLECCTPAGIGCEPSDLCCTPAGIGCTAAGLQFVEITSSKWRTMLGVSFQMGFAIGFMLLSGFAYQWRDWHEMQFVMAMFILPYALALFLVPESPRWLFANGRNKEAKKITRRFAKFNKVELDEKTIWDEAEKSGRLKEIEESKKDTQNYSTLDLFKTTRIRIVTFLVIFTWFANGLVYYGISLNVGSLAGNIFVNNVLGGVMEIGVYIFVILLMDRIGRRMILVIMMGLAGVTLICATIVSLYSDSDSGLMTLGTVFSLSAKVGISGSYAVLYNFTTELFPTVIRMNGVAVGSFGAQIGAVLAPLFIALESYISWLPNVTFGVASLLAGGLALFLPETNGIDMLESIDDAKLFYKNGKTLPSKTSDEVYENPVFNTRL